MANLGLVSSELRPLVAHMANIFEWETYGPPLTVGDALSCEPQDKDVYRTLDGLVTPPKWCEEWSDALWSPQEPLRVLAWETWGAVAVEVGKLYNRGAR